MNKISLSYKFWNYTLKRLAITIDIKMNKNMNIISILQQKHHWLDAVLTALSHKTAVVA